MDRTAKSMTMLFVIVFALVVAYLLFRHIALSKTVTPLAEEFCAEKELDVQKYKMKGQGNVLVYCYTKKNGIVFVDSSLQKLYDANDPKYLVLRFIPV